MKMFFFLIDALLSRKVTCFGDCALGACMFAVGSYKSVDTVEVDKRGFLLPILLQTLEGEMDEKEGGGYRSVFPPPLFSKPADSDRKEFVQYKSRTFVFVSQCDTSYLDLLPGHDVNAGSAIFPSPLCDFNK